MRSDNLSQGLTLRFGDKLEKCLELYLRPMFTKI